MSSRSALLFFIRSTVTRTKLRTWFSRKCQAISLVTLVSVTSVGWTSTAQAQTPPPSGSAENQQFLLSPSDYSGSISDRRGIDFDLARQAPIVVGGSGIKARVGHEAGDNVGRDQSLTYFDMSPYVIQDNWILYGEGRLGIGNNGKTSGSLGAGVRRYFESTDAILGVNAFYDPDNTRGVLFQQWGVGAELLSQFLDVRTNWYFPYGDTERITSQVFEPGSQQFIDRTGVPAGIPTGSWLAFQRRIFTSTALQGFDTLFTVPVPGDLAQEFNLEASAGFYHYNDQNGGLEDVWGWRARVDMDVAERLSHMYLEVTHDKTFKTNVIFGIDINYWHNLGNSRRIGGTQYNRLAEWVRRNRTVVTADGSFLSAPELAINPRNNNPYVIYHVDTNNPGGTDATESDPFGSVGAAIGAAGNPDIIFVHGNSVITDPIVINRDFLQVIGESNSGNIGVAVANLEGLVKLPRVTSGTFNNPLVENIIGGPAVQLAANNVRFAGFDIQNILGGNAIEAIGQGFGGGGLANTLQDIRISGIDGGHGIFLADNTGNMILESVQISNTGFDAFRVERGDANIRFVGDNNRIDNTENPFATHGYAAHIIDANGSVNMSQVSIRDVGGSGIRVVGNVSGSSNATVNFGDVNFLGINSAANEGDIFISDINGSVTFSGLLAIDQTGSAAGQDAFVVRNVTPIASRTSSGGVFVNGNTVISNRTGHGILVENLGGVSNTLFGRVQFGGLVNIDGVQSGTDEAIQLDTSVGSLDFLNFVTINGSNGDGIAIRDIGNNTSSIPARFRATEVITIANVAGTSFNVENVKDTNFNIALAGLTINNRGAAGSTGTAGAGVRVFDYAGNGIQFGTVTVNNQNDSNAIAIDIQSNDITNSRTTGSIAFTGINVRNQIGNVGLNVLNNGGSVSFGELNVASNGSDAVLLRNNNNVSSGSGTIVAVGGRAITVESDATGAPTTGVPRVLQNHSLNLTSVSSSDADYGVYVNDSTGTFTVGGSSAVQGSGGTISGATVAGAYFENTTGALLSNMNFSNNIVGIEANNLITTNARLLLNNLSIDDSERQAIIADNVRRFELGSSRLNGNGNTGSTAQIDFVARDALSNSDPYVVRITNNRITDALASSSGTQDMIRVRTGAGGVSGTRILELNVLNNGVPGSTSTNLLSSSRGNGAAALGVDWAGTATGTISRNTFNLGDGTGQLGTDLMINGKGTFTIAENSLSALGANATGIRGVFTEASSLTIRNNSRRDAEGLFLPNSGFVFNGINSVGVNVTMEAERSVVNLTDNNMRFSTNAQGGTGVRFTRLVGSGGNTGVTLSGNALTFEGVSGNIVTFNRGFEFLETRGVIALSGTDENFVNPIGSDFIFDFLGLDVSQSTGTGAVVNGIRYPF